jgi:hypothetical protein
MTPYERFEREEAQRRGPRVLTTMLLAALFWAGFVAVSWEFWRVALAGGGQ